VAKYRLFLEDEQIRRWFRSVARGSRLSAVVSARRLVRLFCEDPGRFYRAFERLLRQRS